jgi:hypothetical protein
VTKQVDEWTLRRAGGLRFGDDHGEDEECHHTGIQIFQSWTTDDPEDPGLVEVWVEDHGYRSIVTLDPGQALMVAEYLRRAASWCTERFEDAPDFERESTKWGRQEEPD